MKQNNQSLIQSISSFRLSISFFSSSFVGSNLSAARNCLWACSLKPSLINDFPCSQWQSTRALRFDGTAGVNFPIASVQSSA